MMVRRYRFTPIVRLICQLLPSVGLSANLDEPTTGTSQWSRLPSPSSSVHREVSTASIHSFNLPSVQ